MPIYTAAAKMMFHIGCFLYTSPTFHRQNGAASLQTGEVWKDQTYSN